MQNDFLMGAFSFYKLPSDLSEVNDNETRVRSHIKITFKKAGQIFGLILNRQDFAFGVQLKLKICPFYSTLVVGMLSLV